MAEQRDLARVGTREARAACAASWSCPRRWGRAARSTRRARARGRCPPRPRARRTTCGCPAAARTPSPWGHGRIQRATISRSTCSLRWKKCSPPGTTTTGTSRAVGPRDRIARAARSRRGRRGSRRVFAVRVAAGRAEVADRAGSGASPMPCAGDAAEARRHEHQLRELGAAARARGDRAAEGEAREVERQRRRDCARACSTTRSMSSVSPRPSSCVPSVAPTPRKLKRNVADARVARTTLASVVMTLLSMVPPKSGCGCAITATARGAVGDASRATSIVPGGAVDQRPRGGRGHQIRRRSTTRPFTRCSSMISSMSFLST